VADAGPPRVEVRFEYHFDRLLSAKLEQVYGLLVPDQRWPVKAAAARLEESVHEPTRRDLRARVVGSST
jgi:hypothetical protein